MLNKNNMQPYHAHIYFNNNEMSKASAVRVAIAHAQITLVSPITLKLDVF